MSCMEHYCRDCEFEWFDNQSGPRCPHCGSSNVQHLFDEVPDSED